MTATGSRFISLMTLIAILIDFSNAVSSFVVEFMICCFVTLHLTEQFLSEHSNSNKIDVTVTRKNRITNLY